MTYRQKAEQIEIPKAKNFDHIECPFCRDFLKMRDDHDYDGPSQYHPGRTPHHITYKYGVDIHYDCYVDNEYKYYGTTHHTYELHFCPCCGKPWDGPNEASYN